MTDPTAPDARDRAASFQRGAREYRKARPSYPREAAAWLTPGPGCRVLDLAAGTGKLTEVLTTLDLDVIAVEPSEAMRAELTDALPQVRALAGTADAIPLPDGDRDGVVVAQAWHWFDPSTALPEVARVLRPGGTRPSAGGSASPRTSYAPSPPHAATCCSCPPSGGPSCSTPSTSSSAPTPSCGAGTRSSCPTARRAGAPAAFPDLRAARAQRADQRAARCDAPPPRGRR